MSEADWFRGFCNNLRVTKKEDISRRYKSITRRLNKDFWNTESEVAHSWYVGSYGRNTAVNTVSDVDTLFSLPASVYHKYDAYSSNGQSALLQEVRQSISKTYSITKISADGQIISVPFTDGINFEVVPAFFNKSDSYTFPNANAGGSWKTTNPMPELKAIRERNEVCNGNLVPLCRMMRAWKSTWAVPLGGLLIDTLAYNFIINWNYKDKSYLYYDWMCRDFFRYLSNQDSTKEYWRAPGSNQHVYRKGIFERKAKNCYDLSREAINYNNEDMKWTAKQKWREIFGLRFPA